MRRAVTLFLVVLTENATIDILPGGVHLIPGSGAGCLLGNRSLVHQVQIFLSVFIHQTLPVYALRTRRRDREEKRKGRSRLLFGQMLHQAAVANVLADLANCYGLQPCKSPAILPPVLCARTSSQTKHHGLPTGISAALQDLAEAPCRAASEVMGMSHRLSALSPISPQEEGAHQAEHILNPTFMMAEAEGGVWHQRSVEAREDTACLHVLRSALETPESRCAGKDIGVVI